MERVEIGTVLLDLHVITVATLNRFSVEDDTVLGTRTTRFLRGRSK